MIPYELVQQLGFKRREIEDPTHCKMHGWPYFIMTRKIKEGVHVEWSPIDHLATFWNTEKETKFVVEDPNELEIMISVLR